MDNIAGIASAMLSQSEMRLQIAAENVANVSAAGYKRRVAFTAMLNSPTPETTTTVFVDPVAGKIRLTGNPTDLAIVGEGYYVVRNEEQIAYTRAGQFMRASDGRLLTPQGLALQSADGGDVVLQPGDFTVSSDGLVTQAGAPIARVAVADVPAGALVGDGILMRTPGGESMQPASATVRQGAIEMSNVSTADEMVAVMETLRRAETAQRLMNVYDDLMGRVIATAGQA